jgi:hypothetical protein
MVSGAIFYFYFIFIGMNAGADLAGSPYLEFRTPELLKLRLSKMTSARGPQHSYPGSFFRTLFSKTAH